MARSWSRGQAITAEMVERSRTNGTLDGLYEAAGQTPPGAEGDPAGEALSKAAGTAADLWGRFTTKMSEMTDAAGQRMDTVQTKARLDAINDAIGRPVTKVWSRTRPSSEPTMPACWTRSWVRSTRRPT